ncbi:hypothetical protein CPLU01_05981 [Colletotrichum plurivorum]|uniref:Uncharacterized protein n=1 Tax=Colletotrichum plurivorum TaxID=2175906 RepID=A0A8H6KJN8_9PEZI|nr:hypothetical protein CPLU01_05981 [Colletotrichum plurivorum]
MEKVAGAALHSRDGSACDLEACQVKTTSNAAVQLSMFEAFNRDEDSVRAQGGWGLVGGETGALLAASLVNRREVVGRVVMSQVMLSRAKLSASARRARSPGAIGKDVGVSQEPAADPIRLRRLAGSVSELVRQGSLARLGVLRIGSGWDA